MELKIDFIPEPELVFMNGKSVNPMVGLIKHSPRLSTPDEKGPVWAKIGIVGSARSAALTRQIFEEMSQPCSPKKAKKWNLPFLGLNQHSNLKLCLSIYPQWTEIITTDEIGSILKKTGRTARAERYAQIIEEKIHVLRGKNPPPDVIVVSTPEEIEDACKDLRFEKPLIKLSNNDDLHNRVKIIGMEHGIPSQIIRPSTLRFIGTQEKSLVFWNLAVGLLYKSQKGYPWKLTHLEHGTCYVGITFYEEHGTKNRRASMAQVFLETGESFIIRGDPFKWEGENSKIPHLSETDAKNLIEKVIKHFEKFTRQRPNRVVIHKSSKYYDEELKGFVEGAKGIHKIDLVEIQSSSRHLRLFRQGQFPVLRGTLVSQIDMSEHYLYTTGFTPAIETYPGIGTPVPLILRTPRLDSDIRTIAQEILEFTKLDWNNVFVYRKEPVTLCVARKVGRVLSETRAKDAKIDEHYYYYM